MDILSNRVIYTFIIFFSMVMFFILYKPEFMFDKEGNVKPFGSSGSKTLFSFGYLCIIIPIIAFYGVTFICCKYIH